RPTSIAGGAAVVSGERGGYWFTRRPWLRRRQNRRRRLGSGGRATARSADLGLGCGGLLRERRWRTEWNRLLRTERRRRRVGRLGCGWDADLDWAAVTRRPTAAANGREEEKGRGARLQ
ncbi:hypothetical protein Csa_017834, partial [Cucumis sativus]